MTNRFLNRAIDVASESHLTSMHGSLLIASHKIIDTGINSSRSTFYGNLCASVHAEVACLRSVLLAKVHG